MLFVGLGNCRMALRQAFLKEKEKLGHTTIDLGMAIEESPVQCNGLPAASVTDIKGHVVLFPLRFLEEEDLRPVFKESEYYASAQVFH
jgi:phospholipase D1/2